MITAHGDRKRLPAENHHLGLDGIAASRDNAYGSGRYFDRQDNASGIIADKEIARSFVEDVDKWSDDVRTSLQGLKAGNVIGFDQEA